MTITASGSLRRGDWRLTLDGLVCEPGITAVIGPNGSGKTSILRLLAGLEALDSGSLSVDDDIIDEPGRAVFRPAHERRIAVVFQEHRLFAHLRAIDDVAFPLRRRGLARRMARHRALELLEEVGLADRARAHPSELSGGQRQRVAVARALAADPDVLLLDEPLASVDDSSRRELQPVLTNASARYTLLVSHDPIEVRSLAGSAVVLEAGQVVRAGELDTIAADPGSRWAATFVGANVVEGRAHEGVVDTASGFALTIVDRASGPVHVTFPAHAVTLHAARPEGSARNIWPATVRRVDIDGRRARVTLSGPLDIRADVTVASVEGLGLRPGTEVWASVKATELVVVA